jgi:transposase
VAADEDTVRDVVHAFNQKGLAALDPRWARGRPRLISDDDVAFIVAAATARPEKLGLPFTHWSLRKLAAYLARNPARIVTIGRERLRQILRDRQISFQRTRTWKESADPDKDAKLDRIEHVTAAFPDRCLHLTSSGHYRSGPVTAAPGRSAPNPPGRPQRSGSPGTWSRSRTPRLPADAEHEFRQVAAELRVLGPDPLLKLWPTRGWLHWLQCQG